MTEEDPYYPGEYQEHPLPELAAFRREHYPRRKKEMCDRLGISPSALHVIETGKGRPSVSRMCQLLDFIGAEYEVKGDWVYAFGRCVREPGVATSATAQRHYNTRLNSDLLQQIVDEVRRIRVQLPNSGQDALPEPRAAEATEGTPGARLPVRLQRSRALREVSRRAHLVEANHGGRRAQQLAGLRRAR